MYYSNSVTILPPRTVLPRTMPAVISARFSGLPEGHDVWFGNQVGSLTAENEALESEVRRDVTNRVSSPLFDSENCAVVVATVAVD